MWAVWGGAYTLLYALAVTLMPGQAIKTILGYLLGSALDPAGKLFGYGLLLAALTFILWAASLRAVCALSKASVHFVKVLNLTAIALLPTTVSLVAGILLGFIYFPLGIFLVIVGSAAGLVLLYSGLQKLVIFQGPPFWLFVVAYAVVTLVILLVAARIVAPSLINSALNYASALF
jgi:hypothetical protein